MTNTIDGAQSCVIQDAITQLKNGGMPLASEPEIVGPEHDEDYGTCDFSGMSREDVTALRAEIDRGIPLYRNEQDTPSVIASQSLLSLIDSWISIAF